MVAFVLRDVLRIAVSRTPRKARALARICLPFAVLVAGLEMQSPVVASATRTQPVSCVRPSCPHADLTIAVSRTPRAWLGDRVHYRIRLRNRGPDEATHVALTMTVPSR